MYIWSAWPRSTTLVSPVTISTPAARAAAAMASTSARRTSAANPSSRIRERLSACGRAPETARSLTVPLTASSPIEPPGNRIGFTTKLSVVSARPVPSIVTLAGVAQLLQALRAERRDEQPLDQGLRRLAARAVRHRDLGVLELRALAARGLDDVRGSAARGRSRRCSRRRSYDLRAPARSGRSCSRRRRRPRGTPCTCRSRARACRRCRTPCTPTA